MSKQIKRLQLRGISRTPSDRMTEDGGCSESINLMMDNNELAPVITPQLEGDANLEHKPVYIHKQPGYTNYFLFTGIGLQWMRSTDEAGTDIEPAFFEGETLNNITAIGNTVIAGTNKRTLYYLYKEDGYKYLGEQIPEPVVEFKTQPRDDRALFENDQKLGETGTLGDIIKDRIIYGSIKSWENVFNYKDTTNKMYLESEETEVTYREFAAKIQNYGWDMFTRLSTSVRSDGYHSIPFLVRYAVKLYDGSYIYQSVPILLGVGSNQFFTYGLSDGSESSSRNTKSFDSETQPTTRGRVPDEGNTGENGHVPPPAGSNTGVGANGGMMVILHSIFKASMNLRWNVAEWKDLIQGVDIFASPAVANPTLGSEIISVLNSESDDVPISFLYKGQTSYDNPEDFKKVLLDTSVFFKIESVNVSKFTYPDEIINMDIKPISQDELLVKEALTDGFRTHHKIIMSGGTYSLNQRLIAYGANKQMYAGYPFLQNVMDKSYALVWFAFKYFLKTSDGSVVHVWGRAAKPYGTQNKDTRFSAEVEDGLVYPSTMICYPDSRCFKVEIYYMLEFNNNVIYKESIPMEPHPSLELAYHYFGSGEPIFNLSNAEVCPIDGIMEGEDNSLIIESNKLQMSEVSNPFLFPAENNRTFNDTVIGVASTTMQVSTGQSSKWDLYIFTEGGISLVGIAANGHFGDRTELSRDVAIPGSITPIDRAVIFITAKGVLMANQNGQIENLSPYMNGLNFVISENENESADLLLTMAGFDKFKQIYGSDISFLEYIKTCRCCPDYINSRLYFISQNDEWQKMYMYVYTLTYGTWHKVSIQDVVPMQTINSYPESLVVAKKDDKYGLLRLDVSYNPAEDQETEDAFIVTRPFDLDEPDIYKSIIHIRIRGIFREDAVGYILMASNNGIDYDVLTSLTGKSYKLFRLVIVAKLKPTDRISWVDVHYDTRWTNKLR